MTDLSTTYLGLKLKNPLVASASPLSKKIDRARKLEEAGVSAIVMYSLFEEQITHESLELDHYLTRGSDSFAEAQTYLPDGGMYGVSPEKYINQVTGLKKTLKIPVIGSLNGVSKGGWTSYAKKIEDAGADALELNLYYLVTDPELKSEEVEAAQVDLVAEVRNAIKIPLAVKISPFVTSLPNFARRIVDAGANGLVLFNRFYQPDFDLETLEVVPNLQFSTPFEIRLPLMWIALLYGKVKASLAATSGVHSGLEVLKYLMAGADVVMTTSALLQHGVSHLGTLLQQVREWMESHEYESVSQMKGSMSQRNVADASAFERANYIKVLESFKGEYLTS